MSTAEPLPPTRLCSPSPRRRLSPSLDTLPHELLAQIFTPAVVGPRPANAPRPPADDQDPEAPLHLSPVSIPICRILLPFARHNAYHRIRLSGGLKGLERFGATVRSPDEAEGSGTSAWIGEMVREVQVQPSRHQRRRVVAAEDYDIDMRAVTAAFDALTDVEQLDLTLSGAEWARLVSPSVDNDVLASSASNRPGGVALTVRLDRDDDIPVGLVTLARLEACGGIRELRVLGRLPHKVCIDGFGGAVTPPLANADGPTWRGLESLELTCEPHTTGLTRFMASLAELKRLRWTTPGTTDANVAMFAIPPNVCSTVEELEWSTYGYLSRPLDVAFSTLPRLRSLSIASTAATLCPTFFASLHAHNAALERLELHGPRAEGGDAAATCALVSEWLEALVYEAEYGNGAATKLRELVLDVTLPRLTADTALASEARRLRECCARLGISLGGSVLDAVSKRASPDVAA